MTFTQDQIKLQELIRDGKVSEKDGTFAISLATQIKPLSEKQTYWLNKMIEKAVKPVSAPSASVDLTRIVDMFKTAGATLKRPKIKLVLNEFVCRLKVAGAQTKAPGTIYIDDASNAEYSPYGEMISEPVYFGKIALNGDIVLSAEGRKHESELVALLSAFALDPEAMAASYGHLTGNCCFCSKKLTDERSTSVGYGPICAGKFGLNWGTKKAV